MTIKTDHERNRARWKQLRHICDGFDYRGRGTDGDFVRALQNLREAHFHGHIQMSHSHRKDQEPIVNLRIVIAWHPVGDDIDYEVEDYKPPGDVVCGVIRRSATRAAKLMKKIWSKTDLSLPEDHQRNHEPEPDEEMGKYERIVEL